MIKPLENHSSLPLNKQLVNLLIDEIISNNYQPDDRFYTYREIAGKYKTSIITVKLAIQDLIKRNMLYLRPRKGTFIKDARIIFNTSAPHLNSRNIVFISSTMPEGATWLNPFYSIILASLESKLEKNNYSLEVLSINQEAHNGLKSKKLFLKIAQNQLDGVFLTGGNLDKEFITRVMETGIPIVLVDGPIRNNNFHHIAIDDVAGAEIAVEYLIKKGHKKIAYLGVNLDERASRMRLEGYKKALKSHNIKINEKLIITEKPFIYFKTGFENMKILLKQKELPTAVFAVNDGFAFGAMKAIKQSHYRIPEDISIIGFDDIEMASHMHPALTTMHVDRKKIGLLAARRMSNLINKKINKEKETVIKPVLVERESVRNLKNKN